MQTTYGLGFSGTMSKVMGRLCCVSDITGTQFNKKVDKIRDKIVIEIERCRLKDRDDRAQKRDAEKAKKKEMKASW
jgi:hypothetical protein